MLMVILKKGKATFIFLIIVFHYLFWFNIFSYFWTCMFCSRYCATLYEGLKSCPKERHIHVVCDTDFIAHLIGRAEPELAGGRRERHARTIDIAQEEV